MMPIKQESHDAHKVNWFAVHDPQQAESSRHPAMTAT